MTKRSTRDRVTVSVLSKQGYSRRQIAKQLNCSMKFVDRWRNARQFEDKKRPGGPRKLHGSQVSKVLHLANEGTTNSVRSLSAQIGNKVSKDTVWRTLRRNNLKPFRHQRKPMLTQVQRLNRRLFARKYKSSRHWHRWLFTDEKIFKSNHLPNIKNCVACRKSADEAPIVPVTRGYVSLHVWGGIARHGKTPLFIIEGNLTAQKYVKLLRYNAIPAAFTLFDNCAFIFQQDGAPAHTAKTTMQYLHNCNKVQAYFGRGQWPSSSPDLNPIENAWALIQSRVDEQHPRTKQGLLKIVMQEWDSLPIPYLENLFDSMPRRLKAVLENKGGSTKY